MGQGINTVGKISTGIQGLDKMLLGGLQLPLINPKEDISSSEKGIIIVLKGDRGTDKTLFAMQMMHGIAKSLNNLEFKPQVPAFYSLDKNTDQMNDMLLDFIISKCIDKMVRTSSLSNDWTGSRFADAIFDTGKIRAGASHSSAPPPFPENLKSKIDSYISEGIVFYNIRTNSLHFRTAQSIDSQANILFTRRYDKISDYQKISNVFSSDGNFDFRNDFFDVRFNGHIPIENENKDSRNEMEYKYVTTPSHTFSKILSHIQKGAEENTKNKSMPSSCIVIDGLTKISDSDLKSFELTPFEHILRKSALVTIIVIDDLDEKLKISADILIELGRIENNKENYTSHALRISKSVFQMCAYGWHEYKKRDYGIEVYPSSHLLLQQKRYLPQAKILTQQGILENHYLRHVNANVFDDVKNKGKLKEYEEYKRSENSAMDVLRNLYFGYTEKKTTTVKEALQELFGYKNGTTSGEIIAILGSPNSFKFYLAAGSCFCAAKQGIHTLFLTFDRLIDNLRLHLVCPAWNSIENRPVPCLDDTNNGKEKVVAYAQDLLEEEKSKKVTYISEKLFEYHVYERMSAGIGASVYGDRNFDTVYFNEELAHDFASWVSGDSMEPKYHNGSVALIRETGFDYDGAVYAVVCNNQTYIKRVYREEGGLRLVSINPKYKDIYLSYDEDPRVVGIIVGNFVPMEG